MRSILCFFSGLVALVAIAGLAGCDESIEFSNSAPGNIAITKNKCYLSAGTAVSLSATASDPDDDEITFTWTATSGSLSPSSGAGPAVSWTAPGQGTFIITVTVTDGIDSSSESIEIEVGEQILVLPGSNELTDNGSYYIFNQAHHLMVEYLSSLTIHEGVIIVFDNEYSGITIRGDLNVLGTEADPVVFRSNYCPGGSETAWEGVRFEGENCNGTMKHCSVLDAGTGISMFDHATVTLDTCTVTDNREFGIGIYQNADVDITGCKIWDNGSGIRSNDSDVIIRESSIRYNSQFGIHVGGGSNPDLDIENSFVSNNVEGFRLSDSARPRVKNCAIFLNEAGPLYKYAVYLYLYDGGGILDFESNYWGADNGATIEAMMNLGGGNATVDFEPWLAESPVSE